VIVFWVVAALMILAALAFLLWPLMRKRHTASREVRTVNISLYRDELDELRGDLASGSLSREQYQESVAELERNLLDDTAAPEEKPVVPKRHRAFIAGVAAVLPIFAIGLYIAIGSPDAIAPRSFTLEHAESLIKQLRQHLEQNPNDGEGWAVFARANFALGRYNAAIPAFEKANGLRPRDADLLADHADAIARANDGRLEGKPMTLLAQALESDPNHAKALALAGAAAYGAGDFARAADYWQRLLPQVREGSEEAKLVQGRIDEARARASPNAGERGAVRGTVSVSPNLRGRVSPDDTLFVYAQGEHSKMPLSIVRAHAKDLPYSFVLDDSKGMASGVKLSNADEVRVVARISKSGQARTAAGDLQGVTASVKPGSGDIEVVIDQVVGAEDKL
jgi:cytochrome c-type biogenesis protein CcmH